WRGFVMHRVPRIIHLLEAEGVRACEVVEKLVMVVAPSRVRGTYGHSWGAGPDPPAVQVRAVVVRRSGYLIRPLIRMRSMPLVDPVWALPDRVQGIPGVDARQGEEGQRLLQLLQALATFPLGGAVVRTDHHQVGGPAATEE